MNKNIRVWGAVFVGVLLVGAAVFLHDKSPLTSDAAAVVVATEPRVFQETKDTDGDGVPDWEEDVIGTNPKVQDVSTTTAQSATTSPETETSKFAKQFFGEYISKNTSDTPMSAEDKQRFLEASLKKAYAPTQETLFTEKDIVLGAQDDRDTIRTYGNTLADTLLRYPVRSENEVLIFKRALTSGSEEDMKGLDPIISSYTRTIEDIRAIPVPPSLTREHLTLLNSMKMILSDVTAMRRALTDPLPSLTHYQRYLPDADELQTSLVSLKARFALQGVSFTAKESGSTFF